MRNCLRQAEAFDEGPFKVSVRAHLPLHPEKAFPAINDTLQFASNAWSKRNSKRVLRCQRALIVVLSSWTPSSVKFQALPSTRNAHFFGHRENSGVSEVGQLCGHLLGVENKAINEKEYNYITRGIRTAAHRPICRWLLVQHRPNAGNAFNGLGTDEQR